MMPSAQFPDLKGQSVLITGGGSGIGAALTRAFVQQGAKVAFIDFAAEPSLSLCDALEREEGVRPLFIEADLRDVPGLQAAVATAAATNGPVTVLINNAARDDRHTLADVTLDYWESNQAINLRPHLFTAQAVAEGMKAAGGGSIINFTSTSYMINHPDMPSYTAAKAGIVGLTKGLAGHLGPHNIRVNAVAPGWVMTERQKALWSPGTSAEDFVRDRQCIKEPMEADDMAGICLFLASNASRMLTAQVIIVDAGVM